MQLTDDPRMSFPSVPQAHPSQGDPISTIFNFIQAVRQAGVQDRNQLARDSSAQAINQQMGTPGQDPFLNQGYRTNDLNNQNVQQGMNFAKETRDQMNQWGQGFMGAAQGFDASQDPLLGALQQGGSSPYAAQQVFAHMNPQMAEQMRLQNELQLNTAKIAGQKEISDNAVTKEVAGKKDLMQAELSGKEKFLTDKSTREAAAIKNYIATGDMSGLNLADLSPAAVMFLQDAVAQQRMKEAELSKKAEADKLLTETKKRGGKTEEQAAKDDEYNKRHGLYQYALPQEQAAQAAQAAQRAEQQRAFDEWWNKLNGLYGNKKPNTNSGSWSPAHR
jgi:hypothetical protein